jgi:hypothetical protein
MNGRINNLVKYFVGLFGKNGVKGTNFSRIVNKKTIDLKEDEFKQQIIKTFVETNHPGNANWVNPVDILIMSINGIEKIRKQINLQDCNKFSILWIMCLINAKYVSSHDHETELSLQHLSNLGGFQLKDYIYFEQVLLKKLDWRLEISNEDYVRLTNISNGIKNCPDPDPLVAC